MTHNICREGLRSDTSCDGTSQVIRPTYSCPCPTDLRQPCRCPWITWQVRYLLSYLSRNVSPVLQTLQNIGGIEMRKWLHKLTFILKVRSSCLLQTRNINECCVVLLHNQGRQKLLPISSYIKVFLWRTMSSRIFTLAFPHEEPPWYRSNKGLSLPHLKKIEG